MAQYSIPNSIRVFLKAATVATTIAFAVTVPVSAQAVKVKEEKPGMLKQAKVTAEAATASALAKVPGGKIEKAEIEKDDGKLIYSFDIKVAGKSGIDEVAVDAMTGAVIGVEHETPADEAKEAKADAAKAAAAKAKATTPPVKKP